MTKEPIIRANELAKTFHMGNSHQRVLDLVDVSMAAEEFTVIMGPSGAGKSTLMYCLSGMDRPDSGTVTLAGQEIPSLSEDKMAIVRREHCGFIFQQSFLVDTLSVFDNVLVAALLTQHDHAIARGRVTELLDRVNIKREVWGNRPNQISGGEAQRVGVVRAVVNQPSVVFADEPTGALNSENSTAVLDILTDLHQSGQTIVMVTHDFHSALRADRVLYLADGQIRGECRPGPYATGKDRETVLRSFLTDMGW